MNKTSNIMKNTMKVYKINMKISTTINQWIMMNNMRNMTPTMRKLNTKKDNTNESSKPNFSRANVNVIKPMKTR